MPFLWTRVEVEPNAGIVRSLHAIFASGLYSIVLLAERLTVASTIAILLGSVGVLLLSIKPSDERQHDASSWFSPTATLGLASGAGFAISAIGYRGATLAIGNELPWVAGIFIRWSGRRRSRVLLGGYLLARDRSRLLRVMVQWRLSTLAGMMGALASAGWLTAFAMRSPVDVRIVGLVEVFCSYGLSRRFFKEAVTRREIAGILLTVAGIVLITTAH